MKRPAVWQGAFVLLWILWHTITGEEGMTVSAFMRYGGKHLLGVMLVLLGVLLIFLCMPLQVFVIALGVVLAGTGLLLLR